MKNKIKILLVENLPSVADRFMKLLNKIEFIESVDWVSDCEEAVNIYSEINPHIILIDDLATDGMTGFEAARWIKEQDSTTKIIITSSEIRKQFVSTALDCKLDGYVRKDVDLEALCTALKTVNTGGWYYSEALKDLVLSYLYSNLNSARSNALSPPGNLTNQEAVVLESTALGKSIQQIADHLALFRSTVENIRNKILEKIGIQSVVDLKQYAIYSNLIDKDEVNPCANCS